MMMVLSSGLAVLFNLTGLWLAYTYNLTSGATIILVAAAGFFLSMGMDVLLKKKQVDIP
jgi:zinc transport system permease protein